MRLTSRLPIHETALGATSYGSLLTRQLVNLVNHGQQGLRRILRRFSTDKAYHALYSSFISEYEELQHMVLIPLSALAPTPIYYLPHHGVLREDSITTKLRVVFNGSSPTSTSSSLNDILHTGAKLQLDISNVLLWVRRHRYIFTTVISLICFHKSTFILTIGISNKFSGSTISSTSSRINSLRSLMVPDQLPSWLCEFSCN